MTTLICVLVLAVIVLVALWLWRDNPVVVHLQLLGARIHLETKGPKHKDRHLRSGRRNARSERVAAVRQHCATSRDESDVALRA